MPPGSQQPAKAFFPRRSFRVLDTYAYATRLLGGRTTKQCSEGADVFHLFHNVSEGSESLISHTVSFQLTHEVPFKIRAESRPGVPSTANFELRRGAEIVAFAGDPGILTFDGAMTFKDTLFPGDYEIEFRSTAGETTIEYGIVPEPSASFLAIFAFIAILFTSRLGNTVVRRSQVAFP